MASLANIFFDAPCDCCVLLKYRAFWCEDGQDARE